MTGSARLDLAVLAGVVVLAVVAAIGLLPGCTEHSTEIVGLTETFLGVCGVGQAGLSYRRQGTPHSAAHPPAPQVPPPAA